MSRDLLTEFLPGCPRSSGNATQRRGGGKDWRGETVLKGPSSSPLLDLGEARRQMQEMGRYEREILWGQ